jgi:Immunity protein family (Imm11)
LARWPTPSAAVTKPDFPARWSSFQATSLRSHGFFATTPAHPDTISRATWRSGTHIPPDVMPTHVKMVKGKRLFDWLTLRGGATLVGSRFKDIIEAIEPSTHQFFPVAVEQRNGELLNDRFYIFNVVGRIDSIVEEESNLEPTGKGIVASWIYQPKIGEWRCAVNANVIGGRACWTESHYGGRWFISDKVADELKSQKLLGFGLRDYCAEIAR